MSDIENQSPAQPLPHGRGSDGVQPLPRGRGSDGSSPTDGPLTAPFAGRKPVRWRAAIIIVALAALACGYAWLMTDLILGYKILATAIAVFLASCLLLIWLVFFSRLPRRQRWTTAALLIAAAAMLLALVRIDHFSGDFVPTLTWRWTKKPHETLSSASMPDGAAAKRGVDMLSTTPADYPQFLGVDRSATLPDVRLATDWEAHPPQPVWRRPIGAGWSSFAVVNGHAVTQEQRGAQEVVACYDLNTGEPQWTHSDPGVHYVSVVGGDGPRATPTVHAGRVYSMGGTGLLNCLDGRNGKRLWSHDVLAEHGADVTKWGKACSPLVVDGLVIVTGGAGAGPALLAYDADSGKLVWKAGEAAIGDSYTSPTLATIAGERQVLYVNDTAVAAHDPASGDLIWSHPWPDQNPKATQPLALDGDRVFVSSGYGNGCVLVQVTKNTGGDYSTKEVWKKNLNLKTKFTNVVTLDNFVYGLDEGILVCLDLATGKRRWKKGRYEHGQLLLIGDVLLIQAESGAIALVKADPKSHQELATFPALSDRTWNNPVLVGDLLLVRNDQEAACYRLRLER